MEAIVGVWLTSIVGAAAFSAAGYVLGQRGVVVPWLGIEPARGGGPFGALPKAMTPEPPPVIQLTPSAPDVHLVTPSAPLASVVDLRERPTPVPGSSPSSTTRPSEEMTAVAPGGAALAAAAAAAAAAAELESLRSDVEAALSRAEGAAQKARAADVLRVELERQIEALRKELKAETIARGAAEARAQELGDRLAHASEEAASLRHKVSTSDKQTKQLREALQGRVRALTTSEWHRRRDLEEAEEIRRKLSDVSTKLERSPFGTDAPPPLSSDLSTRETPARGTPEARVETAPPGAPTRSLRPSIDEAAALREEVARLTAENRSLRVRTLTGVSPRPPALRGGPPEIDLEIYRTLIDRIGGVAGLRGAVVGDDVGAVLVGSGEHADSLAAVGAYIRDASSRIHGLLPVEEIEEVDLRDRGGMLLSTLVIPTSGGSSSGAPSDLCLVLLGAGAASMIAAKKVVKDLLRRPSGARAM